MNKTLGNRISEKRRERGMKQENLAEKLGVSAQAVSKWENDVSCPDISVLPALARELGITVDELLTGTPSEKETLYLAEEDRKKFEELMLYIRFTSSDGDKGRVNLPLPLVKACFNMGMSIDAMSGGKTGNMNIDWKQIITLVENGVIGKLVEFESADGDSVEVFVE